MHMHTHAHTHAHTYTHEHTHRETCTHTHAHTCTHARAHAHTCTHACAHAHTAYTQFPTDAGKCLQLSKLPLHPGPQGLSSALKQTVLEPRFPPWVVWADIFVSCNPAYLFGCLAEGNSQEYNSAFIFHLLSEPLWIPWGLSLHRKPSLWLADRNCIYHLLREALLHVWIRTQQANSAGFVFCVWKRDICEPVNRILTD